MISQVARERKRKNLDSRGAAAVADWLILPTG
jgi:hypothetical protein